MKSYLYFSWKELKAQKVTALLILIAVVLSTVMTTVIGQAIGILQTMRLTQANALNGDRYATLHQLTKAQADMLHTDERLFDVGDTLCIGTLPLPNSSLSLLLREYDETALTLYPASLQIEEGALPQKVQA